MSFCSMDKIPFGVKSSNMASVAKFSSTEQESYIVFYANNCNNFCYNNYSHGIVFGAKNNTSNYEAYIGSKNQNNVIHKIARFGEENTIIDGNLLPASNITYDIGSINKRWRDLYLSGTSLYLGDIKISTDTTSNSLVITDSSNHLQNITVNHLIFQNDNGTQNILGSDDIGLYISINNNKSYFNNNGSNINLDSILISSNFNVLFDNRLKTKTTSQIAEGSNYYYTDSRVDSRLALKTTDNIAEGSSHLYYTTARVDARIDLKIASNIPVLNIASTSQLPEGSNYYYTDAKVDSRLALKTTDNVSPCRLPIRQGCISRNIQC